MIYNCVIQGERCSLADVAARKKKSTWGGKRKGAGRKPMLEAPQMVTLPLEERDLEALRELAEERGVSMASLVRDAVSTYLKRRGRA